MTSWPVSDLVGTIIKPMTPREIWTTMRYKTPVLITGIICAMFVVLGAFMIIAWLVYKGQDTASILALFNLVIMGLLYRQVGEVRANVGRTAEQTNGTNQKLVDAVIAGGKTNP